MSWCITRYHQVHTQVYTLVYNSTYTYSTATVYTRMHTVLFVFLSIISYVFADDVVYVQTMEDYEALEQSPDVVIVYFTSAWCGTPCQEFSGTYEGLYTQLWNQMIFAQVSIDSKVGREIANRAGALQGGLPHLQLLRGTGRKRKILQRGNNKLKDTQELVARIQKVGAKHSHSSNGKWMKIDDEL